MGMYDSFRFMCPKCGNSITLQSKAGVCELKEYTPANVSPAVAGDLHGETGTCKCGFAWIVVIQQLVTIQSNDSTWRTDG